MIAVPSLSILVPRCPLPAALVLPISIRFDDPLATTERTWPPGFYMNRFSAIIYHNSITCLFQDPGLNVRRRS